MSIAPGSVSTSGGAQTAGPTGASNRFESKMVYKYKNAQIHNYTVTQIQNTQHSRTGMYADCWTNYGASNRFEQPAAVSRDLDIVT